MVAFEDMLDLDRYALVRWQQVKKRIYEAYDNYQFHTFYHAFINFCIGDLSSFYLDILKDRLYAYKSDSRERRSAQTVLFKMVREMSILMAPVLSFTADEIFEFIPDYKDKGENIFIEKFAPVEELKDEANTAKWKKILEVRKEVTKALEIARAEKTIGHPLDADIILGVDAETAKALVADEGIERIFIVSEVKIVDPSELSDCHVSEEGNIKVKVTPSENSKCERCWTKSPTVGEKTEGICSRCAEALS
jgi:isoleucyl-tRNA synthetase